MDGFVMPTPPPPLLLVTGGGWWRCVKDGFLLPDAASTFVVGYRRWMVAMSKRGVKVKLQSIIMPLFEFDHEEKGNVLYAMELALSLEKLTNKKFLNLHEVANENNDVHLADFIDSEFLGEAREVRFAYLCLSPVDDFRHYRFVGKEYVFVANSDNLGAVVDGGGA
ncbi:hypothetical protein M8C21_001553 [Ambrosia artemisiifolia]|uniref:Ferritin/DPS domain-containing protein n=1 Tax=Ambrosia artemisiifolia TaxID=4212 RepID=A0AAD5GG11_AMBAR|nr:hypothetical protein M8C21_001553 [Ambrosia artemisiifolia]